MKSPGIRELLLAVAVSLVLVAAGHLIVLQRSRHGPTPWLRMSPDALQYIAMARGEDAAAPYSYRILTPYLASLLPLPPEQALRLISYASLSLLYTTVLLTLARLGFGWPIRLVSLGCLFSATSHLYVYSNPYLTDAFGLACLSVMLYALLGRKAVLFAVSAAVGILARETTVFLVPAFVVTRRWRALGGVLALSVCALLLPRLLIHGGAGYSPFALPHSWSYFAQAYLALGVLWVPLAAGLALAGRKVFPAAGTSVACLLLGALASSLKAADTIRMFALILPVAPICWAFYFSRLWRRSRALTVAGLVVAAANIPLALPTRLLHGDARTSPTWEAFYLSLRLPVDALHLTGLVIGLISLLAMARGGMFRAHRRRE